MFAYIYVCVFRTAISMYCITKHTVAQMARSINTVVFLSLSRIRIEHPFGSGIVVRITDTPYTTFAHIHAYTHMLQHESHTERTHIHSDVGKNFYIEQRQQHRRQQQQNKNRQREKEMNTIHNTHAEPLRVLKFEAVCACVCVCYCVRSTHLFCFSVTVSFCLCLCLCLYFLIFDTRFVGEIPKCTEVSFENCCVCLFCANEKNKNKIKNK